MLPSLLLLSRKLSDNIVYALWLLDVPHVDVDVFKP